MPLSSPINTTYVQNKLDQSLPLILESLSFTRVPGLKGPDYGAPPLPCTLTPAWSVRDPYRCTTCHDTAASCHTTTPTVTALTTRCAPEKARKLLLTFAACERCAFLGIPCGLDGASIQFIENGGHDHGIRRWALLTALDTRVPLVRDEVPLPPVPEKSVPTRVFGDAWDAASRLPGGM